LVAVAADEDEDEDEDEDDGKERKNLSILIWEGFFRERKEILDWP
jgi:hypothetical protein